MNGIDRIMLDTNLFVYLLEGKRSAAEAIFNKEIIYSFITEIELLGNNLIDRKQQNLVKEILSFQRKVMYDQTIGDCAISIKQHRKIKIPDAIIAATAITQNIPLLTADKAFAKIPGLQCIIFEEM